MPTVRDLHAARAAALRSPAPHDTSGPNYPIEIDTSGEGMWLLAHYCTPAATVRVCEEGRSGEREKGEKGKKGGGGNEGYLGEENG